jgi:hypothetical protein
MLDEEVCRDGFAGHLEQMLVVREEQHLGRARDLREDHERRPGARVVELHEQIVEHERHRLTGLEVTLEAGEAQRQEQLVALPGAHPDDRNLAVVRQNTHEVRLALGGDGRQSLHFVRAECREQFPRPLQERSLMLAAVVLHRSSQGVRREPQLAVALKVLDGFSARLRYALCGQRRLLAA